MLTGPLLLPPLLVAALLLVSGAAKARRPEATRSAFDQLRLPDALATSSAPVLLPWAEIVLAAALVLSPPPAAVPVAVLALVLFLAYLGVILRALTFDHPVTCSCFGELGLGEVTRRTAVRNVLLVAVAGLSVWSATAGTSVAVRLVAAPATVWVWLILVVLAAAVLLATFGGAKGAAPATGGTAGSAEEADYVRQPLPFATLADPDGRLRDLHQLVSAGAVLLVFVSPGCGSCRQAIESIPRWAADLAPVRVIGVVSSDIASTLERYPRLEGHLMHDTNGVTSRIFGARTPAAVLLGGDGLLAGGPVSGGQTVVDFVEDVRAELLEAGVVDAG